MPLRALQHTATHCNTLQHTATHCNSVPYKPHYERHVYARITVTKYSDSWMRISWLKTLFWAAFTTVCHTHRITQDSCMHLITVFFIFLFCRMFVCKSLIIKDNLNTLLCRPFEYITRSLSLYRSLMHKTKKKNTFLCRQFECNSLQTVWNYYSLAVALSFFHAQETDYLHTNPCRQFESLLCGLFEYISLQIIWMHFLFSVSLSCSHAQEIDHLNTLLQISNLGWLLVCRKSCTPQHTATHGNIWQYTATHCNTLQHTATHCDTLQHTATHYITLQYTVSHCNTLQHTASHCNILQQTICIHSSKSAILIDCKCASKKFLDGYCSILQRIARLVWGRSRI